MGPYREQIGTAGRHVSHRFGNSVHCYRHLSGVLIAFTDCLPQTFRLVDYNDDFEISTMSINKTSHCWQLLGGSARNLII